MSSVPASRPCDLTQTASGRRGLRRTAARPALAATLALLALASPSVPSFAETATDATPTTTATATATATTTTAAVTASTVAAPAAPLPFDLPAPSVLRGSARKAFAHYVPWFPVSIDNKEPDYYDRNFLVPGGEGGKHAAYGGFLRDRPAKRPISTDTAWRVRDLEADVRAAVGAGMDGFIVDIVQLGDTGGTQWTAINNLLQAARNVDPGFSILLMPDMTGPNMESKSAPTLAKWMAHLGASPAAHRLADGRLVISPFTAERKTVAFWTEFTSVMQNTYGTPVAFFPLFQNERNHRDAFDPISYGMTNWGNRNPAWNNPTATGSDSPLGRAAAVKALGQKWMQPVSVQDERPREGIYDEAENTQNLRNTWQLARATGADYVQIPTWNDYAEGSQIAPSAQNGSAWLDLNAYYLTWFKTGTAPQVVRDAVYLSHRGQPHAALPTYTQTLLMKRRGTSSSAPRDTVEALTFLTAPATVRVTVGSTTHTCQQDAGVDTCTVPLGSGSVSAVVVRSSTPVTKVTSPRTVTSTPYVQDLQYVAASSGRQHGASELRAADMAPSAPAGLSVTAVDGAHVATWTASTDDWGVRDYAVHRSSTAGFTPSSSTLVGTSSTPSFTAPRATVGTWHYRVVASDFVGNVSAASAEVSIVVPDTAAPSVPAAPTAAVSGQTVSLTWPAATDDVAVTGYEVHRSATAGTAPTATTLVSSPTAPTYGETAPTGTWYYRVVAKDAAGNRSAASAETSVVVTAPVVASPSPSPTASPSPSPTTAPTTTTTTVRPAADAYANEGAPSTNYGTSGSLSSRRSLGAVSYLRFNVPATPAGKTLRSATLTLRTSGETFAGSVDRQVVKTAGNTWSETAVTWNARPAVGTQVLGTLPGGTTRSTTYSVTLSTSALQSFAGTARTFAVTSEGDDSAWYFSRNYATTSYAPQLVLTYS